MVGLEDIYGTEDDPELVRESMPSNLKTLELLIGQSPENPRLLLSAAQAFTVYAYAFILRDAETTVSRDLHEAKRLRGRARKLFTRAKRYALRALEARYPGFEKSFEDNAQKAVQQVGAEDVSFLYWTAAAFGGLASSAKDDPAVIIEIPKIGYLLDRALEIDESYDEGALHEMMIAYSISRPDAGSSAMEKAQHHFERALQLSGGKRASVYVSRAKAISVRNQDRDEFLTLLNTALSIDVDEIPSWRLSNILAQERAEWLKGRVDELFF